MLRPLELRLGEALRLHPAKFNYRWSNEAREDLLELLFRSIAGWNDDYFSMLFPNGRPAEGWVLAYEQGTQEGFEYTEAARGKRCGHIFASGETTYHCATCTIDENCVLCSRCFDASDHTGHRYSIAISMGSNGCCDCGDDEAFKDKNFLCGIHTALEKPELKHKESEVPLGFQKSIRESIAKVLDYFCDVISCAPEQLRLPKSVESIKQDEIKSRLSPQAYGGPDLIEESPEYTVNLWNDEKHTVDQVTRQVARACRERNSFGLSKAHETDEVGRAVVKYGRDLNALLKTTAIIEQIKLPVTVRTARDTYREMMCGTIVDWLKDIAGCSIGSDGQLLQTSVCEELLQPWHVGSQASNAGIGRQGLFDYDQEERDASRSRFGVLGNAPIFFNFNRRDILADEEDDEEGEEEEEGIGAFMEGGDDDEEMDENITNNTTLMNLDSIFAMVAAREFQTPGQLQLLNNRDVNAENDGDDNNNNRMNDEEDMDQANAADGRLQDFLLVLPEEAANLDGGDNENEPFASPPVEAAHDDPSPQPQSSAPEPSGTPIAFESEVKVPELETGKVEIPPTPGVTRPQMKPPSHWETKPRQSHDSRKIQPYEDMRWRTRLDWLIIFDLRLWKSARQKIRDLCLATVVNVPQFKRILGLRFAALYPALAQLFLIADREPECSVVNLSVQLLSTPSITEEVVERGNFLTTLMAILYSFLTTRQVGEPQDVNTSASLILDNGSLAPRRLQHYFSDMKFVLTSSPKIQQQVRTEPQYLLQFIDLVKLTQGLSPSERVMGQHIEYEADGWIGASLLMREINRLCRMFCDCFHTPNGEVNRSLCTALVACASATMQNSVGLEKDRFTETEIKDIVKFKLVPYGEFEQDQQSRTDFHRVVDFVVEKSSLSFYHPLHYMFSQFAEYARQLSQTDLRTLLDLAADSVKTKYVSKTKTDDLSVEDIILAMFDYPIRLAAWCTQIKAGLWVRNGISLRHQMSHYRSTVSRDLSYYRDIFLIQTASVVIEPARFLASIAERFGINDWIRNKFVPKDDIDESQHVDIAEDFVHLLVIVLTDRSSLTFEDTEEEAEKAVIRKEIAHVLCFKPLSFNDLTSRIHERYIDSPYFDDVLEEVANFRPPEGINDTGIYDLKKDYLTLVDPYGAHYSKNNRDDAENLYKEWVAKKTGKKAAEVVYEPTLSPIPTGAYTQLSSFTKTPLFAQYIHHLLEYCLIFCDTTPTVSIARMETFLHITLHLMILATLDDGDSQHSTTSFSTFALKKTRETSFGEITIIGLLQKLSAVPQFQSCVPQIRHLVMQFRGKNPEAYTEATKALVFPFETAQAEEDTSGNDKELKKKQALERQARVMAQFQEQQKNFINAQTDIDWGVDDLSDEEEESSPNETKAWKYPSGNCILCQEETNDGRLYGTFALMLNSRILRKTVQQDRDFFAEALTTPVNLDQSAEDVRPFGVASQNVEKVRKLDPSGGEVIAERRGIGKGFPPQYTVEGPVTIGCGHIMHYSCFGEYYTGIRRRHSHQIARNHPERLDHKEFVCPLCKALGNAFLPVTWKPKEPPRANLLEPEESFEHHLAVSLPWSVSRFNSHHLIDGSESLKYSSFIGTCSEYISQRFTPALAAKVDEWSQPTSTEQVFPPMRSSKDNDASDSSSDASAKELFDVYKRLRDTMRANKIHSQFDDAISPMSSDLTRMDALIRTLGLSISAVEIGQRGIAASFGKTLLDGVSHQTISLLRVLSETVSSYIAVGALQKYGLSVTMNQLQELQTRQLCQLLFGHPGLAGMRTDASQILPLLMQDSFCFLAESSLSLVSHLKLEPMYIARLCYIAEIVKCVLSIVIEPRVFLQELAMEDVLQIENPKMPLWVTGDQPCELLDQSDRDYADHFAMLRLLTFACSHYDRTLQLSNDTAKYLLLATEKSPRAVLRTLRVMIEKYALVFLRKTTILFHSSYGVDFPDIPTEYADLPEFNRLTVLLHMPALNDLIDGVTAKYWDSTLPQLVSGWIEHYNVKPISDVRDYIWLPHPAIPELIGLPQYYDVLLDECTKRRCPTTGKAVNDPAICLFCGEIFCSQATCCQRGEYGGCNQHLSK